MCRGVLIGDDKFSSILPNWRGLFIDNDDVNVCGKALL